MSKLSFRARHLDPSKQMPIYLSEELPDLPEYSAINRAVPQMPSGMEKEEESEHHLQRAICTGLIIPTPEVLQTDQTFFDAYYPPDYKMPRQMIHMQPLGLDTDVPDYDMDSVDKDWLNQQQRLQLTELKFEQMMDRLEKSSGQTVVTLNEAKTLLNQDDETSISVYDYWLNKRLKTQHPLILIVKTESRPGASSNNPYLAFRRRTEKMQTRKNRKNDEASYEKMLKLRRDLQRATTILEMVRRREETKRDHLKTTVNIFEKRVEMRDFNGAVYSELNAQYKNSRPVYNSLYTNQYSQGAAAGGATATGALLAAGGGVLPPGVLAAAGNNNAVYASSGQYLNSSSMTMEGISAGSGNGSSSRKEKRPYKKRKHKLPREKQQQQSQQHSQQQQQQQQQPQQQYLPGIGLASSASASGVSPAHHLSHLHHLHRQSASPAAIESNVDSEEDDYLGVGGAQNGNKLGSESEEEAPFAFRRKISCNYLRMRGAQDGRWPWEMHDENDEEDAPPGAAIGPEAKYRYTLTSVNYQRPRCIGFARRRLGRGGRVLLDRARSRYDDLWSQFDYTVLESVVKSGKPLKYNQQLLLPKPSSPPTVVDLPSSKATVVADNGNVEAPLKIEPAAAASIEQQQLLPKEEQQQQETQNPETREEEGDEEEDIEDEDELCTEDENVSRLSIYSSAVTLQQSPYDQRMKRRRLRRKKQQLRELNAAKRLKSAVIEGGGNVVAANVCMDEGKPLPLRPLPRAYLHRLAIALHATTTKETTTLIPELQTVEAEKGQQEQQLELKQEICDEEQPSAIRHANHQNHRSNNNNNTVLNNNNNNNNNNNSSSNSNMNKNVSISEKFNVIKVEETIAAAAATDADAAAAAEEEVASTSAAAAAARAAEAAAAATTTATNATIEDVARTIKRELIDADDSNEPLSSIRTAATMQQQQQNPSDLLDDDEAEDDVNLAQLSSIIRHTAVKKELQAQQQQQQKRQKQEELQLQESQTRCFNQMPDVIRLHNKQLHIDAGCGDVAFGAPTAPTEDDECFDYMGGLSPTSSQRLDICNELLSEIRRDWLHFRPKTPTDELSDSNQENEENSKLCSDQALVDWTQDTPISLEMSQLGKCQDEEDITGVEFMSSAFKYTDLDADAQLLQTAYALDYARSPDNANNGDCSDTERSRSGSGSAELEFNLSGGDSLNDINNLLGDDHMLVNILQECSMDDPKALNQTTNFWNGILEGEGEGAAVVDEVENAENLLDCKATTATSNAANASSSKRTSRLRTHHHRAGAAPASIGSSSFTVAESPVQSSFFSQTPPVVIKQEQQEEEEQQVVPERSQPTPEATPPTTATTTTELASLPIKLEPMETTTTTIATAMAAATATPITLTPTPTPPPPPAATLATVVATPVANVTIATPQLITVSSTTAATTTTHLLNIPAQITTQHAQQQQQQQKVAVTQQLLNQFNATPAATATQLIARSELVSSAGPAVGDIVTISPHTGDLLTITPHTSSSSSNQQQQQQLPTLSAQQQQLQHQLAQAQLRNVTVQQRQATPQQQQQQPQQQQQLLFQMQSGSPAVISSQSIVTSRSGNHMIYTTSSGEIVGGQKVTYAIQKSGGGSASIGPNTVITLSNVKLQNDDNNSSQSSNPSSVNIINTASGQQLAVHSISGIQQQQQQQQLQQQQTTSSTPLIVTTPARNNNNTHQQQQQQLQVQQQQQQQQPIVWRQVSGTNTAVATTAVLSTTATSDSPTAVGNKILWTSRATQKRQLNGPENTDINKLLLNRKFSQRKVGQQAVTQQQIQLTKQQLQQLVQQEDELVTSCSSDQLTLQDGNDAMQQQQQQQQHIQQHQQLQKFSKVIKMAQFPLLVSDLNLQQQQQSAQQQQQQQQQQQKPNSAAAIAANHNYSLQPATAIITSQAGTPQQANKIFLTSSNSSGGAGGNFTIATASELQAAVAGQQKLHYKELPNSNLKLNFVTSAAAATMNSGDTLVSQASQQLGATTVVLNKTGAPLSTAIQQQQQQQHQQQQQQQQHQHHQKLKTSGGGQVQVPVQTGDKRVLYTSLLNVKPLQKNNSGQMQMQLGPAGLQQVLRGRLNNSAILTRTLPIGTTVNSTGGGGGTPTTIRQLVTSSSNNNNNASSNNVTVAAVAAADAIGKAEVNKTQLTVEQVIASANNGGVVLPTSTTNNNNSTNNNNNNSNSNNNNNNANSSNNNNNGNGNGSSGAGASGNGGSSGAGGGVNATTSNVNVSATPTINR